MKNLITLLVVITLAWASLFIIIFHETGQLKQLLSQNTTIITQQKQTIDILSGRITDLQNHDDCLFNLNQHPNHANAFIANSNPCMISTLPRPTDSPAKTSTPSTNTKNSNPAGQGSGSSTPSVTPKPQPVKNLLNPLLTVIPGGL